VLTTADNLAALRLDNLNLQYQPVLVVSTTTCDVGGAGSSGLETLPPNVPITAVSETPTPAATLILTFTTEPTATAMATATETVTSMPSATATPLPPPTLTATPTVTETATLLPSATFTEIWTAEPGLTSTLVEPTNSDLFTPTPLQ
jgi:hypothetical protein